MKLFRVFLFFFLTSLTCIVFAQTQIANVNANFIKLDPFGNIFAVKDAQLFKISSRGEILYTYSDQTLGVISSIDVFNPMKIMLFYQTSGTLVFLNEQLTPIQAPIYLHDMNLFTISLASYSAANQIHLYDYTNQYLLTFDFFMREVSRTPLHFSSFNPSQMIELEEKNLAFHNPQTGIYFFDTFGTFYKSIPIITPHAVEITSELIYYTNHDEVVMYNYKSLNTEIQPLPTSPVVQTILYRNNRIVLLQNGTIWIF